MSARGRYRGHNPQNFSPARQTNQPFGGRIDYGGGGFRPNTRQQQQPLHQQLQQVHQQQLNVPPAQVQPPVQNIPVLEVNPEPESPTKPLTQLPDTEQNNEQPVQMETHNQQADVQPGSEAVSISESEVKDDKTKPWMKKGLKVPKHLRKRRQNARLKNLLTPKNSMMVLYELHPDLKLSISEEANPTNQMTYIVKIDIEGRTFLGHGMSKATAKQVASENALKAVLIDKIEKNNVRLSEKSMDVDSPVTEESETDSVTTRRNRLIPEDDVPWGSLASFALYKLFTDWHAQGFHITSPSASGITKIPSPAAPSLKPLPIDANQKHPVQLLNQIRPGSQYVENREGVPPNLTFTFTVVVDGKVFKGMASNKKDAKKECAKRALENMGVTYF